ncbi:MAG: HD domain-containing protein [Gemmatimonadaceae bacterium]|nr:HD domain-containing protein [Gemmatimonadaceae bacterium]NUQ94748.1 HD domain-containing protein [Gemmatimonadaceae bacterium]NUR19568.1 HD domain-containing protein [Gemmatimonadaceae bacterium]NUS98766.1 HD domain-containing protein [Gemmatimonadaceae bacterium]
MTPTIVRDPLWKNVRLDDTARRLVDAVPFQRLRYVRQLGLAHLVYPGATHTRFEHALGTHHLASLSVELLADRDALGEVDPAEPAIVRAAALLHDIGHYPFSHALEEIGAPSHEEVARPLIMSGPVADILRSTLGADAPGRIVALVRGESLSPLQGLISGSLDLDKLDYLRRDAFMCGVPYGEIDVDRLLNALAVVRDPDTRTLTIGVAEKALSALESLLFAKYQMYRNVYWHHTVRSATALYKRVVSDAIERGALRAEELAGYGDEGLLSELRRRAPSGLLDALVARRLHKRAIQCPAAELAPGAGEWIATDRALVVEVENRLAAELKLAPGAILLDYPEKTQMLGLDLPVVRRNGDVVRLTASGLEGAIHLPALSQQLYASARWLRVFVAERVDLPRHALSRLAEMTAPDVRARLREDRKLL